MKGGEDTLKLSVELKYLDKKLMNQMINIQRVKFELEEDGSKL